jgi:hypothetical protein
MSKYIQRCRIVRILLMMQSSLVDILAMAGPNLKNNLRSFVAGDPTREQAIDISDAGVENLAKEHPNLATIALHGTRNLKMRVLPVIFLGCAAMQAVTFTVARKDIPEKTSIPFFLDWLSGGDYIPSLLYLELRGVYHDPTSSWLLDFLTSRELHLEVVYEWGDEMVLIRSGKRTTLSSVEEPVASNANANSIKKGDAQGEDDEDAWEDEPDSEEERQVARKARIARNTARRTGREIRRLGAQRSMSEILGRDVGNYEMETSLRDQWDFSDSNDEDIDPREMSKILRMMRDGFGLYD